MRTVILWTFYFLGPDPYVVRDLTNAQCQQMKQDMTLPASAAPYRVREKQKKNMVCKPQR
jgi:hypothetical protein